MLIVNQYSNEEDLYLLRQVSYLVELTLLGLKLYYYVCQSASWWCKNIYKKTTLRKEKAGNRWVTDSLLSFYNLVVNSLRVCHSAP